MKLDIQLFASGTISGTSTASNCSTRILWSSTVVGNTDTEKANYNKSRVTGTVQVYKSGSSSSTGTFSGNLNINGVPNSLSKYGTWKWGQWNTVGSVTIEVPHNQDGTKQCSISCSLTQTGTSMAGTYTASAVVTLDRIPRNSILESVNEYNSIQVDTVVGSVFVPYFTVNLEDTSEVLELIYDYGGINEQVIKTINDVTNTGTYYFTQEELEDIWDLCPNDWGVNLTAVLTTYVDGVQFGGVSTLDVWCWLGEASPVFNTFDYDDINPTTLALTGDSTVIIKGYSNLKYTITDINKAVAQKGSTMSYYSFKAKNGAYVNVNSLIYPIEVSGDSFNAYNQDDFQVIAVDSRGLEANILISDPTMIKNYIIPSVSNIIAERVDGVSDVVNLSFDARYWAGNFGNGNNTIAKAYYRVKQDGGDFGNWVDITNAITKDDVNGIASVDNLRVYDSGNDFAIGVGYTLELELIDGISSSVQFNTINGVYATIEDGMLLDSYYKDSDGYRYAINNLVDPNGATLQVNGDITASEGDFNSLKINNQEVVAKNILTGKPESDATLSTTSATKITLVENVNIGDKLSISSGGIKIGSGVSKVLVSGTILFSTGGTSSTRKGIQIYMYDVSANTTDVVVYNSIGGSVTYTGASCTPFLLEVEENDIIYMYGINQGASGSVVSSTNSYLTVEVVE